MGSHAAYLRAGIVEYPCDGEVGNHSLIEVRHITAAMLFAPLRGSVTFMLGSEMVGKVRA